MATATLTVREATPADVTSIVALARAAWPDSPFKKSPPDDDLIANAYAQFLAFPNAQGWVLTDGESVLGVLGVYLLNHLFTTQKICVQWWWWVYPHARGGQGLKLLHVAEKWAIAHGAEEMHLNATTPEFARLCERMSYNYVETTFGKELRA